MRVSKPPGGRRCRRPPSWSHPIADLIQLQSATIFDANTAMLMKSSKRRKVIATVRPIRDSRERFVRVLISLREDVKKVYM